MADQDRQDRHIAEGALDEGQMHFKTVLADEGFGGDGDARA